METLIIIGLFILTAIFVIAYGYYDAENRAKKLKELEEEEQKLLSSLGAVNGNDFNTMMDENKNIDPKLSTGETNLYKWTQEASDIEMYVKVDSAITRKEVKCEITSKSIKLSVNGNIFLDDDFYAEVDPDECNWQLDGDGNDRCVWLTIHKKVVTIRKKHWPYILDSDANTVLKGLDAGKNTYHNNNNDSNNHGLPPVYNVNTNDSDAMKAVINKIKMNNEEIGIKN